MQYKFLYLVLISTIVVAFLNKIASAFYLYWTLPWFDNVVHFFGGLAIGLFALWLFFGANIFQSRYPGRRKALITSLASVLVVGIGWEIFEYMNGLTQSTESYPLDVFHDLISDMVGAFIAGEVGSRKKLYGDE